MIENILSIKQIVQGLSNFEVFLILLNLIFIIIIFYFIRLVHLSIKQNLITRNLFINFSDSCAHIIDQIKPNINYSMCNYYEYEMKSEFGEIYKNIKTDLDHVADTAKKELKKEIIYFQKKLRDKGLEELNKQDILNERVSIT